MNLIIDVGNTLVKCAVFKKNSLLYKFSFELAELPSQYNVIKDKYPEISSAIISSVGHLPDADYRMIQDDIPTLVLSHNTKLPFQNDYKTPNSLGVDRMALVSASVQQFSEHNVLVIDAGTCITYDFINAKNQYLGGAISPGIRLRYRSLNNLTANLPLLDTKRPEHIIGNTTDSSIHSGVVFGVIKEIDGVIEHYRQETLDLTVILTGGDAKFLSNQLKNTIFANSNFLLEGLNFILDFNLE